MGSSWIYVVLILLFPFSGYYTLDSGRKELRDKGVTRSSVVQLGSSFHPNRINPSRVIHLSWRPRVFLYRGFLSDEECNHLITLARRRETINAVKGSDNGSGDGAENRRLKSSEALSDVKDDVITKIEERISTWTFLPKENGKPAKVLHLEDEKSNTIYDYFHGESISTANDGLAATVILFLSNVTKGGEILFPNAESRSWSDCGNTEEILRPVKGNAILFFTLQPNVAPDEKSLHARCPVLEGEMWCAIKSFYLRSQNREGQQWGLERDECTDEDENCPSWAEMGECQRNPVYMIGSPDYSGTCRKSCNAC